MAGRGPAPKPAHLRQRTNRKAGATTLELAVGGRKVPAIPNPDGREWHPLTSRDWAEWWRSPMAGQWLDSDISGLGQLAVLHDEFYKRPNVEVLKEIRLQRPCYGLTPLDRSRLQWEVGRAEEAEQKQQRRQVAPARRTGTDPRAVLMAIK